MTAVAVVRILTRLNVGGPARQAIELSAGLPREGFRTLLVAGDSDEREGDLAPEAAARGIEVVRVPGLCRSLRPGADAGALASLARLLRRVRPRIVHTHMAKAGALGRLAAAIARVPVRVHTFHGHTFEGYFGAVGTRANLAVERFLARRTTRIVAVSERVHDDLVRLRVAPADRIVIVRGGLDLAPLLSLPPGRITLEGDALRREIGVPAGAALIVAVGRLARVKCADRLVRALLALDPSVHLALVGDGPEREATLQLASELGVGSRLHWTGFRFDLRAVYGAADVVASASDSEGLPLALVEAMAGGRPVVATEVGGVPELVVAERTGLLVPPGDGVSLATALATLLRDARVREEMGARGRARVRERYAAERLVRDTAALYRALLEEAREG